MGDERFDELSKTLARPVSRRQAVKIFAGTAALSMVGLARSHEAEAQGRCRKVKARCRNNYECCSFFCDPSVGRCACPPGTTLCKKSGFCFDCRGGTLDQGTCTCNCPTGFAPCGTTCCNEAAECCLYSDFCVPIESGYCN